MQTDEFETLLAKAEQGDVEKQAELGRYYIDNEDYENAFVWNNKAAKAGNARAQTNLGNMYHRGDGVEQDDKQAMEWYEKAAKQELSESQYALGLMYTDGQSVKQDYKQAIAWYEKAAEQEHTKAQYNLGGMYYEGKGVEQNYKQGINWIQKAAKQGLAQAQTSLGQAYYLGHGVKQDYKQAIKWIQKAATQDFPFAQYFLGEMYADGQSVKQDYKQTIAWYEKAAMQGQAEAQHALGNIYYYGHGINKDYKQAVSWYEKSAKQDYALAQHSLGNAYYQGYGVNQDYKQAISWYEKSAKQDLDQSQYDVGAMYSAGQGVKQDYKQAISWYKKAAKLGHINAKYQLATIFLNEEEYQDLDKALHWLTKAAEQGHVVAQYELSHIYLEGLHSIEANKKQAFYWYDKAVETAYSDSAEHPEYKGEDLLRHLDFAEQGYAKAQFNAAMCFYLGENMEEPDEQQALKWFTKSAAKNNVNAQLFLAYWEKQQFSQVPTKTSILSQFLPKKTVQAPKTNDGLIKVVTYLLKGNLLNGFNNAALSQKITVFLEQENTLQAKIILAHLYQHGFCVEKNRQKQEDYLQQGVEQADIIAEYQLGLFYKTQNKSDKALNVLNKVNDLLDYGEESIEGSAYSPETIGWAAYLAQIEITNIKEELSKNKLEQKNIELEQQKLKLTESNTALEHSQERMQNLVEKFTHSLANIIFPQTIYEVVEKLKDKPELRRDRLLLHE